MPPAPEAWERLTQLREEVAGMLEEARRDKQIGSSLEAAIGFTPAATLDGRSRGVGAGGAGLADLFIVSAVSLGRGGRGRRARVAGLSRPAHARSGRPRAAAATAAGR